MVSVLVPESSGPGSIPGRRHCVVSSVVKTLYSHGASLHAYTWVSANFVLGVTLRGEKKYS